MFLLIPTLIFLPEIYKTGFTLYSLSFQVRNIMENESGSELSGPQVMEHRTNSKPDTPSAAVTHSLINRKLCTELCN